MYIRIGINKIGIYQSRNYHQYYHTEKKTNI